MTKSELWILSEWRVAQNRLKSHSEKLIAHRYKTPFAELDLVLSKCVSGRQQLRIIEVKTWQGGDLWAAHVISSRQRARILRACHYLSEKNQIPVLPVLAIFDPRSLTQSASSSGTDFSRDGIRYFDLEPSY